MTYLVLVEPADEQRRAFARWCLAQDPPIMTTTASGSEVPADVFRDMPEGLLVGAYVDGHLYQHVAEEPVRLTEIRIPVNDGPRPEPLSGSVTAPKQRSRRTPRKAAGK